MNSILTSVQALFLSPVSIALLGAVVGATASAFAAHVFSRARIVGHVTGIQLSAQTLSRVDMIKLPSDTALNYQRLLPWLPDQDALEADDCSVLPLGRAQEVSIFIEYLMNDFNRSIDILRGTVAKIESESYSSDDARLLLSNTRIDNLLTGMIRRFELPNIPDDFVLAENTELLLPLDEIQHETGNYFRVNLTVKSTLYQYLSNEERNRNQNYLSAILTNDHGEFVISLLNALRDNMVDARNNCANLSRWFSENLEAESSLILTLSVSNLGSRPAMLESIAILELKAADGDKISIPLRSEAFQADSVNDETANRTVALYKAIAQSFGVAMTFDDKVSFDRTVVPGGSVVSADFRSTVHMKDISETKRVLQLFSAANEVASVTFWCQRDMGKNKKSIVKGIPFGPNKVISDRKLVKLSVT